MTRAWTKERKWELSKAEKSFEDLLRKNNYKIVGYREYMSKTDMMICKNDVVVEWSIPHVEYLDVKAMFKGFEDMYKMYSQYAELTAKREEA